MNLKNNKEEIKKGEKYIQDNNNNKLKNDD